MDTSTTQRDQGGGLIADRAGYLKMCELGVEEQIKELPYFGVNKEHLELISCVQLDNLDVDNIDAHRTGASAATFFKPSGPIDDELKDILSQHWVKLDPGAAAPRIYPEYRATWFTNPWTEADLRGSDDPHIDRFGGTAWQFLSDPMIIQEATALKMPREASDYTHQNEYSSDFAFFPKDESKPHLACCIWETFINHDKMLRSELHGAVALIKYQLATWNNKIFGDRPIKPVMLYTFQSDKYARITQAYFDRSLEKIVLRQSRLFDLYGDKPTADAWLLLRWMLNTPAGDTSFKEEDTSLPIVVKEPAVSPAKSTHITVTSPSGNTGSI